jgi:hypothetical protein
MDVIQALVEKLNDVGATVRTTGVPTELLHRSIVDLAVQYAHVIGVGCRADAFSTSGPHDKTLVVCGTGGGARGFHEAQFLFDQCWLLFHSGGKRAAKIHDTDQPSHGYMIGCELAVESEWHGLNYDPGKSDAFHRDFRKLIVAKAPNKAFIFACSDASVYEQAVEQLRAQIICARGSTDSETYLISCYNKDTGRFSHKVFNGKGDAR